MRITSKGQVTIPLDIRNQLGLLPNSEVEFEIDGDAVRVKRAGGSSDSWRAVAPSSSTCAAAARAA